MIQLTKKKKSGKKVLSFNSITSKVLSSASYANASTPSVSSKKPTYFSSSFSTHRESSYQSFCYLLDREMSLKEEFNTLLQHAFFDQGKEFWFSKIHLIHPTKFGMHSKRKITFPSLSTNAASNNHFKTSAIVSI